MGERLKSSPTTTIIMTVTRKYLIGHPRDQFALSRWNLGRSPDKPRYGEH
jgi:hypothetical protein